MCGRFTLYDKEGIKKKFSVDITPSYNVAPSQNVLVIDSQPHIKRWSFTPDWAKEDFNLINCRSETMHEKPSFRNTKRCVFAVNGWYEWKRDNNEKQPYYFSSDKLFYLGGLMNETGCCIVTKQAEDNLSFVHHRQPIVLKEEEVNLWVNGEDYFNSNLANQISAYKVSKQVNSPRNNEQSNIDQLVNSISSS